MIGITASDVNVQFPLELSKVFGHTCVTARGEAYFGCIVHNISDRTISVDDEVRRLCQLSVKGFDSSSFPEEPNMYSEISAELSSKEFNHTIPPSHYQVSELSGGHSLQTRLSSVGATTRALTLSPGATQLAMFSLYYPNDRNEQFRENIEEEHNHAQATFMTYLELGHPSNTMSPRPIQARPFQVQLTSPYRRSASKKKILLVTNNRVAQPTISLWKKFIGELMGPEVEVAIWNVSLYGEFPLARNPANSQDPSLAEDFSDKNGGQVIIFMNNKCNPSGFYDDANEEHPGVLVRSGELFKACKSNGCRILVLGGTSGMRCSMHLRATITSGAQQEFASIEELISAVPATWDDVSDKKKSVLPKSSTAGPSSLQRRSSPAMMSADIKGMLKVRKKNGNGWGKRFVAVRSTLNELAIYKKPLDEDPLEVFPLADSTVQEDQDMSIIKISGKGTLLELAIYEKRPKIEDLKIEDWRTAIEQAISKAKDEINSNLREECQRKDGELGAPKKFLSTRVIARKIGDTQDFLKNIAITLLNDLQIKYPLREFVVTYENTSKKDRVANSGVKFNKKDFGEIQVFNGLDIQDGVVIAEQGPIFGRNSTDVEDSEQQMDINVLYERNQYGFFKVLSFKTKLEMLKNSSDEGTIGSAKNVLHLLVDAIVSDIVEECIRFCSGDISFSEKLIGSFSKKSGADQLMGEMKLLKMLTAPGRMGKFSKSSHKYGEIIRLISSLQLVSKVCIPPNERVLKSSRAALTSRAMLTVIESLESRVAKAMNEPVLKLAYGTELSKYGTETISEYNEADLLFKLRYPMNVGLAGTSTVQRRSSKHEGIIMPLVEFKRLNDIEKLADWNGHSVRGRNISTQSETERTESMFNFFNQHRPAADVKFSKHPDI